MNQTNKPAFYKTGGAADIAFAIVVLASYFATFSAIRKADLFNILMMSVLGIAYIIIGIYGFSVCSHSVSLRLHLIYFMFQIPLGAAIVYFGKGAGFNALVLVPLVGHAVVLLPQKWGYIIEVLIVAVYLFSVRAFSNNWAEVWVGFPIFFAALVFVVVFTQMAVDEEKARQEVERLMAQLEELTITQERNRIAREIHDGLGHYLTTVHMQIQAARVVLNKDTNRANVLLEKAQTMAQEALLDVRESVAALRSSPSEQLPLQDIIKKLINTNEISQITTNYQVIGSPRQLSQQSYLTLFRSVQEGINNTIKHANASQLNVSLDFTQEDTVKLTIMDNGIGTEDLSGGYGLIGLQERVHLINGSVNILSQPGEGFKLEVIVPG